MKKRIILIILVISIVCFLIAFSLLFINNKTNKIDCHDSTYGNFTVSCKLIVNACKKNNKKCNYRNYLYPQISYKNKDEELQKVIKKINTFIKKKYNETLSKKTYDNTSCSKIINKYDYYDLYSFDLDLYDSVSYITIMYRTINNNLCSKKTTYDSPVVYVYSKEKKSMITQEEFQKELNIGNTEINNYLESATLALKESFNEDYSPNYIYKNNKPEYMLYYNYEKKLSLYYYQSIYDDYYIYTIDK